MTIVLGPPQPMEDKSIERNRIPGATKAIEPRPKRTRGWYRAVKWGKKWALAWHNEKDLMNKLMLRCYSEADLIYDYNPLLDRISKDTKHWASIPLDYGIPEGNPSDD